MSIINHLDFDEPKQNITCPYCEKSFKFWTTNQTPGFRMSEELLCPHCYAVLRKSLEYEFHTEKE